MLNRLSQVIKETGLSQRGFAEKIGISAGYLTDILKGRKEPSGRVVRGICADLKLSERWLITGEGQMRTEHSHTNETETAYALADNMSTLRTVIVSVEEFFQQDRRTLAPDKKAELIIDLYEMFLEEDSQQVDKGTVTRLIRMASKLK